jgi:uncharacterized damage-inducible protein DinB
MERSQRSICLFFLKGTPVQPQDPTLATFYDSWKRYQDLIKQVIAPLTGGQLALRAAPGLRSIGESAMHIVGCRMYWFTEFLGEDGGADMKAYERWNEAALALRAPIPTAAELAQGLDHT